VIDTECYGCGHDCKPTGKYGECYEYCEPCAAQLGADNEALWTEWFGSLSPGRRTEVEDYFAAKTIERKHEVSDTTDLDQLVFGDVPIPDGCKAYPWTTDDEGTVTRLLAHSSRSLDGVDASVFTDGVQDTTGAVVWELSLHANTQHPVTSGQARQYAAMIVEAADEYDGLSTP
jgi:hypothetical protein